MNKRLDDRLIQFNMKYQKAVYDMSMAKKKRVESYISRIRKGDFAGIIRAAKYRSYGKRHFRQAGNSILNSKCPKSVEGKRIAAYSCIIGRYDEIIEPINVEKDIDYILFTDLDISPDSVWRKIDVTQFPEYKKFSPVQMNRKIKILPELFLKEYDYSIYLDGNIEIVTGLAQLISDMGNCSFGLHYHNTRDCIYEEKVAIEYYKKADTVLVNEQLTKYENEGFPHHFGLFENSILIRAHLDSQVSNLMKDWWKEYQMYPTRDQLSLPYILWKSEFPKERIFILGNNIDRNPRFNREMKHTYKEVHKKAGFIMK